MERFSRPKARAEVRAARPKFTKRPRTETLEKLSRERGYSLRVKLSSRSEGRIHVPADAIPEDVFRKALTHDGTQDEAASIRNAGNATEYYISGNTFTIQFSGNCKVRRAFRRFLDHERIRFLDVSPDAQKGLADSYVWDETKGKWKRKPNTILNGRCAITDIVSDDKRPDGVNLAKNMGEKGERAVIICVSFYDITDEMRQHIMRQTWVRSHQFIKNQQPSNSSADHRLGEKLKHMKLYDYQKSAHREQGRALIRSFHDKRGWSPKELIFSRGHHNPKQKFPVVRQPNGKLKWTE